MVAKLSVSGLNKQFNDLHVLCDINLSVAAHELVAFVGPSGCGKTTFLRIIGGLEEANSGIVTIDGRTVRTPGADRGFVFQQDNLLPWRDVLTNVLIGPEILGARRELS